MSLLDDMPELDLDSLELPDLSDIELPDIPDIEIPEMELDVFKASDMDFPELDLDSPEFEMNDPETVRMFNEFAALTDDEPDSPAPIVTRVSANTPKCRKAHRERKKQGNKQK